MILNGLESGLISTLWEGWRSGSFRGHGAEFRSAFWQGAEYGFVDELGNAATLGIYDRIGLTYAAQNRRYYGERRWETGWWTKWAARISIATAYTAAIMKAANLDVPIFPSGDGDKECDKYPENPDDWKIPEGWNERNTGDETGGRHRQWEDENGNLRRRWDREGREGGRERGPHWHDMDDGSGGKIHH